MNLQKESIKSIFSTFSEDEQCSLIRDLMRISKIDSIVRINSFIRLNGKYIGKYTEEDLWKERFEEYIFPFLATFLIVIDREYINNCFDIFKILANKSIGSKFYSQEYIRDKHLYAYCRGNKNNLELFNNEIEKKLCFINGIFDNTDIELTDIGIYIDNLNIFIKFTDFLVLISNDIEKAYLLLHLFRYLDGDLEKRAKEKIEEIFGEANVLKEENKEKLCNMFRGLEWQEIDF